MASDRVITSDGFSREETSALVGNPIVSHGIDLLHHELVISGPDGHVSGPLSEVHPYPTVSDKHRSQFAARTRAVGEAWVLRSRMDMLNLVDDPDPNDPSVIWLKEMQIGGVRRSIMSVLREVLGKDAVRALDGIPIIGASQAPRKVSLVRSADSTGQLSVDLQKDTNGAALARVMRV